MKEKNVKQGNVKENCYVFIMKQSHIPSSSSPRLFSVIMIYVMISSSSFSFFFYSIWKIPNFISNL
jgi:hypothetical protein